MTQSSGQGALEVTVGFGRGRIGAQGVAEGEMPVERGRADGADVQVMRWRLGGGGEGFAAGHPKVALVLVAEGPEPFDHGWQVGTVGDH
jgi:hypothetical protein